MANPFSNPSLEANEITPTPSVSVTPSRPIKNENIKQLYRRYSDGTLVLKEEEYDAIQGFQYIQYDPASTWSVIHNLKSRSFTENVFVDNKLVEAEVRIIDACKIEIVFSKPVIGFVNLVFLDDNDRTDGCYYPPASITPSPTPTLTPTATPSPTVSVTPTQTATVSLSLTPSITSTITATPSPTNTPSSTPVSTQTPTITQSAEPTVTPSSTAGISATPIATVTPTATLTPTLTVTPTVTSSPSVTITPSSTSLASPTPTLTISPTITITPTLTASTSISATATRTPTPTPTPSVTLTEHNCKFDGSSLSGWVNNGAEMVADPTDSSKQVIGVPEHAYAYINCDQPFDISTQITVDVYMPTVNSVVDLLLGCNSTGAGVMVRFDSRNYPNGGNDSRFYCGFLQSSSWTEWSGDPTNGYAYAFPTAGWHTVNVRVNNLSDSGLVLDMYIDGVFACRSVPLTQYGNYIGFNGDQNGNSYGYLRNFQITRDYFITPTPSPTQTVTATVTPSVTKTITITPSVTKSITVTPSITPTISLTPTNSTTPTPTPTQGWAALAHRYWRMNISANNGSGNYVAVTELSFYNDSGSASNLVNPALANTNYIESSEANSDNNGHYAFDGNNTTKWTAGDVTGYIGWDFGSPQLVKTVGVIGNYIGGDQTTLAPKNFTIEYSDNGSSWTVAATITNQTAWGAGEKRIFTLDAFSVTPTPTPSVTVTPSITLSTTVTPTLPTSPTPSVTSSATVSSGPLLHFDGANGSTTITDSHGGSTWTAAAPAQLSTAQAKFGTASLLVNGASVSTANMGAVLAGDFCIEGWANTTSPSTTRGIFQLSLTNDASNLGLGWDTGGLTWQLYNSGSVNNSTATSLPNGWFHWAVYRVSGTIKVAINGGIIISVANNTNFDGLKTLTLGTYYNTGFPWVGYIDEFRITLASSPYTAAGFTPPTAAFT